MTDTVATTYDTDDWFDLDKYKQAAEVAYGFSKKKLEDKGEQDRTTIKQTKAQEQEYSERDEARDHRQSQAGYRY